MANKAGFSPYGIIIPTENGNLILNAGANMTIFPSGNLITFASQTPPGTIQNGNGLPWSPPSISDGRAPNNSIYVSTTTSKLTYRDANGVTHTLY